MGNIVLRNFILSITTAVLAGLALWASESGGDTTNVPWLLLVGFGVGCLGLSLMGWWRRRTGAGADKKGAEATGGKKKGRGR